MKKILAILLALVLALGMFGAVSAEEDWITLRVECFDREITGLDVTDCWQLHYAQENFGDPNHIKLEFVSFARWTEGDLLTNALAGGTAPDLCMTYGGALVQQCIDKEGIWQLDELIEEYAPNLVAFIGEELLSYGQSDHDGDGVKEQWFIPARRLSVANVGNFIRADWLEALGMEKPTTVDEFTDYLRAAKAAQLAGENTMPFSFGIYAPNPMFNVRRFTDAFVNFDEVTEEDWRGNPSLVGESMIDEECTLSGKTTGRLYVVPEASADGVEQGLRFCVTNDYLGLNPNQQFFIVMSDHELVVGKSSPETFSINKTVKHQLLYAQKSCDGHFYILVLDETTGAFCIPRCWKHIIQIKDHKEYLIPGAHEPNKDGWLEID